MNLIETIKSWAKDFGEVGITLVVIILVSKIVFGAHMLVPLVAVTSQSMLHTSDKWENWLVSEGISPNVIKDYPLKGGFDKGDMVVVITPDGVGNLLGIKFPTLFGKTKVGDVVIYNRDKKHGGGEPIIHRVVGIVKVRNWSVSSVEGTLSCKSISDFEYTYIPSIVNCINNKEKICPYSEYPKIGNFNFYITKGDNNNIPDQCSSVPISLPVNEKQLSARGLIRLPYIGWLKLFLNDAINLVL